MDADHRTGSPRGVSRTWHAETNLGRYGQDTPARAQSWVGTWDTRHGSCHAPAGGYSTGGTSCWKQLGAHVVQLAVRVQRNPKDRGNGRDKPEAAAPRFLSPYPLVAFEWAIARAVDPVAKADGGGGWARADAVANAARSGYLCEADAAAVEIIVRGGRWTAVGFARAVVCGEVCSWGFDGVTVSGGRRVAAAVAALGHAGVHSGVGGEYSVVGGECSMVGEEYSVLYGNDASCCVLWAMFEYLRVGEALLRRWYVDLQLGDR